MMLQGLSEDCIEIGRQRLCGKRSGSCWDKRSFVHVIVYSRRTPLIVKGANAKYASVRACQAGLFRAGNSCDNDSNEPLSQPACDPADRFSRLSYALPSLRPPRGSVLKSRGGRMGCRRRTNTQRPVVPSTAASAASATSESVGADCGSAAKLNADTPYGVPSPVGPSYPETPEQR